MRTWKKALLAVFAVAALAAGACAVAGFNPASLLACERKDC